MGGRAVTGTRVEMLISGLLPSRSGQRATWQVRKNEWEITEPFLIWHSTGVTMLDDGFVVGEDVESGFLAQQDA
ncbi:hypothetical protein GCG54_00011648 [Colletotrichum gloeosporioides]|uniref:Uncharacterized protein n=1 Tax=Colletotrichum gloeosporioides TaxID=474922 RepID=A0A8H4FIZ4_COLGL|nr:uncharacterized protein GCG54_00011648 [Colletotrichum gloeosporioides]KAF3803810.1 hypothetical protein GCG54_00011648 [Colletotrichum gloeosporioides]